MRVRVYILLSAPYGRAIKPNLLYPVRSILVPFVVGRSEKVEGSAEQVPS